MKLLIANRGEIAIRIMRGAAELDIPTVAIYSEDDASSLHTKRADEAIALKGKGVSAYLDAEQIISVAAEYGCDAIHPGYGFLAENVEFARLCKNSNITFVGPDPEILEIFGEKVKARELAESLGIPVLKGTAKPVDLKEAAEFMSSLGDGGAIMIKAVAGGGGRGMRAVFEPDELEEAYTRSRSEALKALGNDDVYVEQLMPMARHIEVQIIGDGSGAVSHLGERECSLQRRYQKLVEIAPSPGLPESLRQKIIADAVRMAEKVKFSSLGTFEFLVDAEKINDEGEYYFIEANPRLQVEHTVTEEVTGVDLVQTQIKIAGGSSLESLKLTQDSIPSPSGFAMQVRVNMETMDPDGSTRPAGGTLSAFEVPTGRGIRVDTMGYGGYTTSPNFDSLLAKLIGYSSSSDFGDVLSKTYRALCEFRVEGVRTNIPFLQSLLKHPAFASGQIHTRFVDKHIEELAEGDEDHPILFFNKTTARTSTHAGAKIDETDPLAVLDYGRAIEDTPQGPDDFDVPAADGTVAIKSRMQGTIVSVDVSEGDLVRKGQQLLIMDSMKMEHVVEAETSGLVIRLEVAVGDTVFEGHLLAIIEEREVEAEDTGDAVEVDLDYLRPDLAETFERHGMTLDPARPEEMAKRFKRGQRTIRENIDDLCDEGTFMEYGSLVIAAQRRRRTLDDLIARTPADGLVAGLGQVNGHLFGEEKARCVVMSYDYTVLAGTQGKMNHAKKDRMFELAERMRLPMIFFTEGGGGRPGDTDATGVAGLDCMAFYLFGKLSGLVPIVGINSGRCFAGNAALLGCCDVIIAAKNSNIGMGGPAMIEGGGLGVFKAEEVGPMSVQVPNGVVDIAVENEEEAVQAAKKYLSYFQGPVKEWEAADQRLLRNIIPENRLRIYDVREVIKTMADTDSVLELRPHFGLGMVTAFMRVEGRPMGVIANNPTHLSGAIDSPGADKAARFMQLCDAFDIPILTLADTPGIMVGPEIEKTALVRHCCRMFVTGASITVPLFTIILRKSYGLGAQAMAGGSFRAPIFTVAWPTGEFGGMGLEGAVKLGYRRELEAIDDPAERKKVFDEMVARSYEHGKAINTASHFEIDDVIDPADSRSLITTALMSAPPPLPRDHKKRSCVDTW